MDDDAAKAYAQFNATDPRIAALILHCLGDARSVLNIGAGTGSYEPAGRAVTAVEPSPAMRAQRASHLPPAIDAVAEALPFADKSFDAAMAIFCVHQWSDLQKGLAEMRRVTRGPAVVMTNDPDAFDRFWLTQYAPEFFAARARQFPALDILAAGLGGTCETIRVPIPLDCRDGFNEAYYGRPEMLLDAEVRRACSSWSQIGAEATARFVQALKRDLDDGTWDAKFGALRTQPTFIGALVLLVSRP